MLRRCETETALINSLEQKKKEKKTKAQISWAARALNRPGHLPADGSALLRADAGAVWVGSRFAGLVPVSGLANPCSLIKLCVECEWSVRE